MSNVGMSVAWRVCVIAAEVIVCGGLVLLVVAGKAVAQ